MTWTEFREARAKLLDNSISKGKVDAGIVALLESIRKNRKLVTTSSCAGRIALLQFDIEKRKKTSKFYRKWHSKVDIEEVELAICGYADTMPLWFVVEPFVLHVAAKDMKAAKEFMERMNKAGVRRGGIKGEHNGRVVVELEGNSAMGFPIEPVSGQWERIIEIANLMLERNYAQLRSLARIKW